MVAVIGFIVLVIGIIIYYRIKNSWSEKNPKTCDFCGKAFPNVISLEDGNVCRNCLTIPLGDGDFQLFPYVRNMGGKKITVEKLRNQINVIQERDKLIASSSQTKTSPGGKIVVYEDHGLFFIKDQVFVDYPHRISDIKSFKLHIDRDFTDSTTDVPEIEGGHIEIKMNELFDTINYNLHLEEKTFGMKDYVKKAYEDELAFMEIITGKKRG